MCLNKGTRRSYFTNKTLASLIFDLEQGQMHIAFGNACENPFYTFSFDTYQLQKE